MVDTLCRLIRNIVSCKIIVNFSAYAWNYVNTCPVNDRVEIHGNRVPSAGLSSRSRFRCFSFGVIVFLFAFPAPGSCARGQFDATHADHLIRGSSRWTPNNDNSARIHVVFAARTVKISQGLKPSVRTEHKISSSCHFFFPSDEVHADLDRIFWNTRPVGRAKGRMREFDELSDWDRSVMFGRSFRTRSVLESR